MLRNKLIKILQDPSRIGAALRRRMPGVVQVGKRAVAKRTRIHGTLEFKKTFNDSLEGVNAYKREVMARQMFSGRSWIAPILRMEERSIYMPFYPDECRLDHASLKMNDATCFNVAYQAIKILFDIFLAGCAHGDFHSKNLFWVDGRLILVDFEMLTPYVEQTRPAFPVSYDLVGQGLETPPFDGRCVPLMYYDAHTPSRKSLRLVLDVSLDSVLERFVSDLKHRLQNASSTFRTRRNMARRHRTRAQAIYGSFSLPYFSISPTEAQRNSSARLTSFHINHTQIAGKSILDLGCNVGSMLFELQKYNPGRCLGIEYDHEKVQLATEIAAYNGLCNIRFMQADVEHLELRQIQGPFDIILCLALEAHVKSREKLFALLWEVTSETLYFEGNGTTSSDILKSKLQAVGFSHISLLGLCCDDCISDNNIRPLLIARK